MSIAEKMESELKRRAPNSDISVSRLAVNRQQIEAWNLPTRPTKTTDTRARMFQEQHGVESVELDAIPPDTLRTLVKEAIESHMDPWRLQQLRMVEEQEREIFTIMFKGGAP